MGFASLYPSYALTRKRPASSAIACAWCAYSAASLAELFLGLLFAFFSTGARNLPV
ncbi:hypothetical protein ACVILK_000590 [Bradyrhizobium embrapense]